MDVEKIAREIVAIRTRLNQSVDDDERDGLEARMRSLQESLVDPEPERHDHDEVDVSHPVLPI